MKVKDMQLIVDRMGVELRFGDYPYAACYAVDNWERGDWKGLWFANETDSAIIYVPQKYNQDLRAFGFLHEVGHIIDHQVGLTFDSVWDGEVSAWMWAKIMLNRYYPDYDRLAFKEDVFECLGTYAHSLDDRDEQWMEAMTGLGFF